MAKKKVELSQEEKDALAAIENGSEKVEESEQLDELSKATLGSYVKKASKDIKNHKNVENIVGNSKDSDYHDHSEYAKKSYRDKIVKRSGEIVSKREKGISSAVDRLTKESEIIENQEEQEMTKIDETAAHDSLKPNSHPAENPASKVETMKAIIGHLAGMTSDELTKLWDETLSVSKSHVANAKDNSASNRASVSMKPSDAVKEELSVIFDGQELSEDFKDRATTLFEAAVQMTLTTEISRLEEEFETKLAEEIEKSVSEVTESVEKYLDYVAEQFIEENKIAIESTLRAELAETFVEKIRAIFEESHIDLPLEKVDVVEEQNLKIASLEESLNKAIEKVTALQEQLVQVDKEKVFAEVSEGLVLTQVDKFKKLAEAISFDGDLDSYKGKLELVKENFVTKEESKKPAKIDLNESVEEENKPIYENSMTKLAKAIKLSR